MRRGVIVNAGALVALGFLAASAVANYMFGASLGRSPWEVHLYGAVGVLAVAMNALAPFYISWSLAASRRTTAASIGILWLLCLAYSTTSALGFAAQNREATAVAQQVSRDAYEDTRRELLDLEERRRIAKPKQRAAIEAKIDEVRKRLAALRAGGPAPADAQSAFLSRIILGTLDPQQVRLAMVSLFAVMVEMCATLGHFAALSHPIEKSRSVAPRGGTHRWED
jgi:hypothetical protein